MYDHPEIALILSSGGVRPASDGSYFLVYNPPELFIFSGGVKNKMLYVRGCGISGLGTKILEYFIIYFNIPEKTLKIMSVSSYVNRIIIWNFVIKSLRW